MVERREEKRPFSDTQEFVQKAFEERFLGETEVALDSLDKTKPYTQIGEKAYQAGFNIIEMRKGDVIPLVSMSIHDRPDDSVPSGKKRTNTALLYIFPDDTDTLEQIKKSADNPSRFQTLEEIGNSYGVSRQMAHEYLKKYLGIVTENASSELKEQYLANNLNSTRPLTLASRIHISESNGSISTLEITNAIKDGYTSEMLLDEYGSSRISASRLRLEKWGMEAPERVRRNFGSIINEILDPSTEKDRLCELIQEFTNHGTLTRHSSGDNPVVMPISSLQHEAWGNKSFRLTAKAYEILGRAGIPVAKVGNANSGFYMITLTRTKDEALALLKEKGMDHIHTPVVQIAGADLGENLPNTTQLYGSAKKEWTRVSDTRRTKKRFSELRRKISEEGADFPILLYTSQNRSTAEIYIRKEDKEAFGARFKNKPSNPASNQV